MYGINPFDIYNDNYTLWYYLKIAYIVSFIFSNIMISNFILNRFVFKLPYFNTKEKQSPYFSNTSPNNSLHLLIGLHNSSKIYLNQSSLFQNFLITGTIGSRKDIICNVSIYKAIFRIQFQ